MADEKPVSIIRPLSVYMDSDKIARAMSGSYKISSGRDPVITDGGYEGHTGGSLTCTAQIKSLVAVDGFGNSLFDAIKNRKYVTISIPLDGGIHEFTGVLVDLGVTWDHAKGSCEGDINFSGGEPKAV